MNEVLTMAEIEARFPDEWVLIGDPETDRYCNVLSGRVLYHSKDKDALNQNAMKLRLARSAVLFMGSPPPDMVFVL